MEDSYYNVLTMNERHEAMMTGDELQNELRDALKYIERRGLTARQLHTYVELLGAIEFGRSIYDDPISEGSTTVDQVIERSYEAEADDTAFVDGFFDDVRDLAKSIGLYELDVTDTALDPLLEVEAAPTINELFKED